MSLDASLARMETQLGEWKAALSLDQAEGFADVAALVALFRELGTAGAQRAAAIKLGLESAWHEFTSAAQSSRQ